MRGGSVWCTGIRGKERGGESESGERDREGGSGKIVRGGERER